MPKDLGRPFYGPWMSGMDTIRYGCHPGMWPPTATRSTSSTLGPSISGAQTERRHDYMGHNHIGHHIQAVTVQAMTIQAITIQSMNKYIDHHCIGHNYIGPSMSGAQTECRHFESSRPRPCEPPTNLTSAPSFAARHAPLWHAAACSAMACCGIPRCGMLWHAPLWHALLEFDMLVIITHWLG